MIIYLDMDGTIANLYKGEWLADLIAKNPRPYEIADRLVDEEILQKLVEKGYELGIISWLAKNSTPEYDKAVRQTKKNWLKQNYPNIEFKEIHIVKYGTPKHKVANIKNQILVDDEEPNRKKWKGVAITPTELATL